MTLLEIVTKAGRRTNKPTGDSDVKSRFIDHVNFCREIAWAEYDWSWKKRVWFIRTYDQVTSGTVSVTNGSPTVNASGTPFSTSVHSGWYFRVIGADPESWYRVIAVPSTSTITIEPAYQASTNSTASYELRKFDYLVPSELEGMPTFAETENGKLDLETQLGKPFLIPDSRGTPVRGILWSDDPIGSTYSTGTVTGTAGSRTLTGNSTAWLSTVVAGDIMEITVANTVYKYTVRSVESDSSLTLYNFLKVSPSESSYVSRNQFGRLLRITPTADDEYTIALHGTRRYYPLVDDDDTDELLTFYSEAILEGVIAFEQGASPDDRENPQYVKFLQSLKKKGNIDQRNFHATNQAPIHLPYGAYRA